MTKALVRMASIAGAAALLVSACSNEDASPVTPSTEFLVEPTPTLVAEPTATPFPTPQATEEKPKRKDLRPFGAVDADPVRVDTDDGDCLNVRSLPGTTFDNDPRTCVPEGFLLWLYGPERVADDLTWRFALGEGWVATKYVRPDPAAKTLLAGRVPAVIVTENDYYETHFARVEPDGTVVALGSMPGGGDGIGWAPPAVAPSGLRAADTAQDPQTGISSTVIYEFASRQLTSVARGAFAGWGPGDKAAVYSYDLATFAYWEPGSTTKQVGTLPSGAGLAGWAGDGSGLYLTAEYGWLGRVGLDGSVSEILPRSPDAAGFWSSSLSPSEHKLLNAAVLGAVQIYDLDTGTSRELPRPPQRTVGGRCGGASGALSGWIDEDTVMWHESYAEKGFNGITIHSLTTGVQRVVPFFTVDDLRRAAPGLISFSTQDQGMHITWLMDVSTGEARPVTWGDGRHWESP